MKGWFNDIDIDKGSDNVFAFNPSVPGLPAPVKAAPGPNGEEYYYYYYYYDDEEGEQNVSKSIKNTWGHKKIELNLTLLFFFPGSWLCAWQLGSVIGFQSVLQARSSISVSLT